MGDTEPSAQQPGPEDGDGIKPDTFYDHATSDPQPQEPAPQDGDDGGVKPDTFYDH